MLEDKSAPGDVGDEEVYALNAEGIRDSVRGGAALLVGGREGIVVTVVVDDGAL